MAKKSSSSDTKTVTLYSKHGTKVTVSEDQAERLSGYSKTKPSSI